MPEATEVHVNVSLEGASLLDMFIGGARSGRIVAWGDSQYDCIARVARRVEREALTFFDVCGRDELAMRIASEFKIPDKDGVLIYGSLVESPKDGSVMAALNRRTK